MATWVTTTGAADKIRSPQPEGSKIGVFPVEIHYTGGVRVFTETDIDNRDICAVLNSTGSTPTISKGADGDPAFGSIEDISEDGTTADVLVLGISSDVAYAAATEDPDIGDAIQSKGNGKVKQAIASPTISAGQRNIGRGHVIYKDTTNSYVRILWV